MCAGLFFHCFTYKALIMHNGIIHICICIRVCVYGGGELSQVSSFPFLLSCQSNKIFSERELSAT